MARPPKPTAIKKLCGTVQKCRLNPDEPQPTGELSSVLPPEFLSPSAKEIYQFALSQVPKGVLSNLDFGVFTEWVILYDNLINVTMTMQKQGYLLQDDNDDEIKPSKLAAEQRKIIALLHQLQSAMGFTPSSRSRVVSFAKENHTDNPFEGM